MDIATQEIDALPHVVVHLPQWLRRNEGLASCKMEGHIVHRRARQVFFVGHASTTPSDYCHRCSREITNPVSRIVGYGPYCSDELGIPRNPDPALIDEYRKHVESVVWRGWLPISRIFVRDGDDAEVDVADLPVIEEPQREGNAMHHEADAPAAPPPVAVSLTLDGDWIEVRSPFKYKDAIKAIPGRRWDGTKKCWKLPASSESAARARDLLANERPTIDAGTEALLNQHSVRTEAAVHKQTDDLPPVPCSATDAWTHQRQAYWFAKDLDAAGLFMDMGTGKSKVTVDLIVNRDHQRTLVVCPKSVVGVWPREFARHAGKLPVVAAPRKGGTAKRAAEIRAALEQTAGPLVVVVNYEAAWRGDLADLLLSVEWDCVVLDESHRIKAPGGKASMFAAKLGRIAKTRLALTGTPMPHSPLDVYAQFRFLDRGIFGTSFAAFRARFAVMGGYGGHEVLGYQRQDELAERMYRIGFRLMADDVLDLPPVQHIVRTCELEPKARKVYTDLADNLFAEVDAGTVTAANALVRLLRLQQVTSGLLPAEDGAGEAVVDVISTAKRDLLADLLADVAEDEPVVVFCRFTHDLDNVRAVCTNLGRRYGELSGNARDGLAEDATMSPDIDVIGVQIQSGGVGIDLTRARYAVYYSTGFSLGDYEQSLKRVHRPGQTRPTTYYHLQVEDSIDGKVYEALQARKDVVESVLGLAD